jgi:hypothetical protein
MGPARPLSWRTNCSFWYTITMRAEVASREMPELGCWRPAHNRGLGQAADCGQRGRESWTGQANLQQISLAFLGRDRGRDNAAVSAQPSGLWWAALGNGNWLAGPLISRPPGVSGEVEIDDRTVAGTHHQLEALC